MSSRKSKVNVVMVDLPDVDNIALLVMVILKAYFSKEAVVIVLNGRPLSFKLCRFSPSKKAFRSHLTGEDVTMDFRQYVREQKGEAELYNANNRADSKQMLCANVVLWTLALRKEFADRFGSSMVDTIFNAVNLKIVVGSIPAHAGLSYAIHDFENLFFKLNPTDGTLTVTTPAEYFSLVEQIHALDFDERDAFWQERTLGIIRYGVKTGYLPYDKCPAHLVVLDYLKAGDYSDVTILVGGPQNDLFGVLEGLRADLTDPRREMCVTVKLMSLTLDSTGKNNLLGTCFNDGVDLEAHRKTYALIDSLKKEAVNPFTVVCLPTEACKTGTEKNGWMAVPTDAVFPKASTLRDLHALWTGLKGSPQPMFDVGLVLNIEDVPHLPLVPATLGTFTVPESAGLLAGQTRYGPIFTDDATRATVLVHCPLPYKFADPATGSPKTDAEQPTQTDFIERVRCLEALAEM